MGEAVTRSGRRRWYLVGAIVAAVAVAVVVVAVVRPRPQRDYDQAVHDRFISACTAQGGDPVRGTCECFYGQITENVPFDRFELIDESLAVQTQGTETGQTLQLPDDLNAMLQSCVADATTTTG